jgi:hypothetical protein
VIRLAGDLRAADHLPGGELALDARALSVACAERDRCMLATANGRSWSWDGEKLAPLPPTAELGGALMALAGDGAAMVYAVLVAPDGKTLSVVRQAAGGAGRWEPLQRLAMSGEGVAVPTSIVASPGGDLWIAVRDRLATGDEMGRGVVELQLPAGQVVHHRSYAAKEQRPPEALPVAGEVAAVRFRAARTGSATGTGTGAIWLCTSLGIIRFAGGDLTRWGEDEGLETERCTDMIFDGAAVWIGTAGGPARFDGKSWRTDAAAGWPTNREGEPLAARALADCGAAGLRAGTPRGVWSLGAAGPAAAQRPTKRLWDRASGLIDEDVQDLACDRFGRLWVLGRLGVTLAEGP